MSNDTEQSERCMLGDVVFLFNLERGRRVNRCKIKNSNNMHVASILAFVGSAPPSRPSDVLFCFYFSLYWEFWKTVPGWFIELTFYIYN